MAFWTWLGGEVQVKLTSADIPSALSSIDRSGIGIDSVNIIDTMEISFHIQRKDMALLKKLCEKRGDLLETSAQKGLYWRVRGLRHRPVLLVGMLLLIALSLWAQGRVLFVFVEGNVSVPSNKILEEAALCGIRFGSSSRDIRSEKVKNELLASVPQLQWVGVNTKGCVAIISVSERELVQRQKNPYTVSSIVAVRDGMIREMTVLQGTAMCATGQTVKAGQVLISGYTDCGICIRAGNAKGEVYGETLRSFSAFSPTECIQRGEEISETRNYSLIFGKKRINLSKNSGISQGECVRIYLEQYVTLPGGFQLPIAIGVERLFYCHTEVISVETSENAVLSYMETYLQSQMIAGKILSCIHTKTNLEGFCRMDGIYDCYEIIGIIHPEESIDRYENYGTNR